MKSKSLILTLMSIFVMAHLAVSQEKPEKSSPNTSEAAYGNAAIIYDTLAAFKGNKEPFAKIDLKTSAHVSFVATIVSSECKNPKFIADKNHDSCYLCADGKVMCVPKDRAKLLNLAGTQTPNKEK